MPSVHLLVLGDFVPEPVPSPEADDFADQLVRRFEPWLTSDLEDLLRSIASMFDQVVLLTSDTDDEEGWTILFDPERVPLEHMPYLAQFVGERLPSGLTEIAQREWVMDAPNRRRGTPESVFLAAQRRLTGTRLVSMLERPGGVVDAVQVVTYTAQTPDPAGTEQDIRSVLPADVLLTYATREGQTWSDVSLGNANWDALKAKTWDEVRTDLAGYTSYPRPRT